MYHPPQSPESPQEMPRFEVKVQALGCVIRAGSGLGPTQNLALGSWVLNGPTRPGPDFGWPDPARTKKIALLAEKLVKNGPK